MLHQFRADHLNVYVYETRNQVALAAAAEVAAELRRLIQTRQRAIGIFTSAKSQTEFLKALVAAPDIEWTSVIAFHPSAYLGLDDEAPQSLRHYLIERLVKRVPLAEFHALRGEAANPKAVCANYAALLAVKPPDFAVMNVGEIGQLAFNDPQAGDFNDPVAVKLVELDEACRQQQVRDGSFPTLAAVPRRALTLTLPTLMACPKLFLSVAGSDRQHAVWKTLNEPVSIACPASIVRTHKAAQLFLDREAAALLL